MEFSIDKEVFERGFGLAAKGVATKSTIDCLQGVKVVATKEGKVIFTGTDLEIAISNSVDATVDEAGEAVIPAKKMLDLVKKLPGGILTFSKDEKNQILIHYGLGNEIILGSYNTKDYPDFAKDTSGNELSFKLSLDELQGNIKKVMSSAGKQAEKPVFSSVLMKSDGSSLNFISTDGYRLSWQSLAAKSVEFTAIIPLRSAVEITRLPFKDEVSVKVAGSSLELSSDGIMVAIRLLDGEYPNVQRVVPTEFSTTGRINKEEFLSALERCAIVADEKKLVHLNLNGKMEIKANGPAGQAHEVVGLEKEGEDLEIAFNPNYLIDGLKAITGSDVELCLNNPLSPAIIQSNDDGKHLYMVLPVRTN